MIRTHNVPWLTQKALQGDDVANKILANKILPRVVIDNIENNFDDNARLFVKKGNITISIGA